MDGTFVPKIPLGTWADDAIDYATVHWQAFFDGLNNVMQTADNWFVNIFSLGGMPGHAYVLMAIIAVIGWRVSGWKIGLLALAGLWLVDNLGYWDHLVLTLSLVVLAVLIAVIVAVPLGIWMSQKDTVQAVVTPILDFMQTMPAFVYLIPVVLFLGLGPAPGIIATIVFSMPPTVRLTNLGLRQVPAELLEAAEAFGSTTPQRLGGVQIPLAMPTLMAGINQTIMLSLSMVVISSLVGAAGLGTDVYGAVTSVDVPTGIESGLSIVIIAMVLDRITQSVRTRSQKKSS
jgi:ABC-type proline/glycine betaine transport system permease subunit